MTYELNNQEKAEVVNQHLKNVEYSLFNLNLSLVEEQAVATPNATNIASINSQITEMTAKKTALLAELADLA
jgi:hypothetical protein